MIETKSYEASLAEELPYWEFNEEPRAHVVLNDGALIAGLKLSLLDIECLSDSEINYFTQGLRSGLNALSEGVTVQFLLSVDSNYEDVLDSHINGRKSDAHPIIRKIAENRELRLVSSEEKGELYRPSLQVFLKVPFGGFKKTNFLKKQEVFTAQSQDAYEETLDLLWQNVDVFKSTLTNFSLQSRVLERREILEKVYKFLNPRRSKLEPAPNIETSNDVEIERDVLVVAEWLASSSPREKLVFGDLILSYDQFTLDSYFHRVITLKTLPEVTFAGQLANFLRMPFHYDLLLTIDVPPQASEMAKLQQKRKMAHSLAVTDGNKASDLESETKLSSTEELIRELLNSGQRIYAAQMTVILREPASVEGTKALNRHVREVLSRFRALQGAEALEETVGAWKVLKGTLPAAPMYLERARKIKTNNLADFLPLYGPREGDKDPVVIFRNRLNGLVSFNPFDPSLPNYNALVTGSSGAGKSFLNNCILMQELARNLRVFIIDIGGSYKKLTQALGGQYLEVDLSDKYKLNPFDLPDPKQEPSNQKLKSLLAIIESMVAENNDSKLPKLDRVLLEKAIIEVYEEKRQLGEVPILSDLVEKLKNSEEPTLVSMAKMLFTWTGNRPFGKLLDGPGSLRTDAGICTFDLKGLSSYPDLQSVMILILTDFILSQVETDKVNKKRIILDEAWELLKSQAAANFMEYCARTLRKSGSGITFITQGVEEIVASPIGSAILNNTATKFVMLQRGDSAILQRALKLNDQELSLIASLEQKKGKYSEGFMIEGDHRQVVRVYPSSLEYWLSTSDSSDNRYLGELMEKGLDLEAALERASEEFPQGVAAGERSRSE